MAPKVGMRFYDAHSGEHKITKMIDKHNGFEHEYINDKGKKVTGFMYSDVFVKLTNQNVFYIY